MKNGPVDRRALLRSAALLGATAALARPGKARALSIEPMPPMSAAAFAYANRCGPDSAHAGITARLRQELAADPARQSLSQTCPLCGCPIIVTR